MTIVLQDHKDSTRVLFSEPDDAGLWAGMRFHHAAVPRSLDEDRRFIADLSDPASNGVRLSGIETPADIEKASALLRVVEADRGMAPDALVILAVLDTARAALGLADFNRRISRLVGFLFDAGALAETSGVAADSDLLADLRLRLPLAARSSGARAFLTTRDDAPETMTGARRNGYNGICLKDE